MKVLSRKYAVSNLDCRHPPAIIVEPPESLVVETLDARCGKLRKKEDVYSTMPVNPATGPIEVKGARPGDAVVVKIEDILLDKQGYTLVKAGVGIIGDMVSDPTARIIPVKDGYLYFSNIKLQVEPMVGVIAPAPKDKTPSTMMVGEWGGNMDNKRISRGAKVFLPVFVDGAMVYIGDVHAKMGDAEATGTAVEIGAKVKISVALVKNANITRPYIETADFIITTGAGSDFYEVARVAVEEMIKRLVEIKGISQEEAYMLIGIAGDVRLNQACNSPVGISVRVEFPKKELY